MTEPLGSDERLAEAFRALGGTHGSEISQDLRDRVWLAVSGALPPEERRELVERMATDPGCAEAWRMAHELWQASEADADDGAAAIATGHATGWTWSRLAAAAVLLFAMTIGVVSRLNRPAGDEFRASPAYVVQSLLPVDMPLPRDGFRLRWTPGPEGSRYQVRVTTLDLQVLATAADLAAPEYVVEPAVLTGLLTGSEVLWQVDVALANGERITSPTFVTPLQ